TSRTREAPDSPRARLLRNPRTRDHAASGTGEGASPGRARDRDGPGSRRAGAPPDHFPAPAPTGTWDAPPRSAYPGPGSQEELPRDLFVGSRRGRHVPLEQLGIPDFDVVENAVHEHLVLQFSVGKKTRRNRDAPLRVERLVTGIEKE